jgi:hypothetical protein
MTSFRTLRSGKQVTTSVIENSPLGSLVWRRDFATAQRRLLVAGGGLYGLAALWVGYRGYTDALFADLSLGLLGAVVLIYGLTYLREERVRHFIVPVLTALVFAAHIVLGIAAPHPMGLPAFRTAPISTCWRKMNSPARGATAKPVPA